jgi:hypothetical protein
MSNPDDNTSNQGNVSADEVPVVATIANFLAGMDFPKTKDQIVEYTKNPKDNENKERQTQPQESQPYDSQHIMSILRKLQDKQYQKMTELSTTLDNQGITK